MTSENSKNSIVILFFTWICFRIPVIAVIVYFFREPLFDLLGDVVDVYGITVVAIKIAGTPFARIIVVAAIFFAMLIATILTRKLASWLAYSSLLLVAGIAATLLNAFPEPSLGKILVFAAGLLLLALNLGADLLPRFGQRFSAQINWALKWLPGTEFLFANRYALLVCNTAQSWSGTGTKTLFSRAVWKVAPALLIFAIFLAATTSSPLMVTLEQALRQEKTVQVFGSADTAEIAITRDGRYLIASGHGLSTLLRYDLSDVTLPPLPSSETTDGAQSLFFQPGANEASVEHDNVIKTFDVDSMKLTRSVHLTENMATGDARLVIDPTSKTIAVVSEVDKPDGAYMLVVDQANGRVLSRENYDAGNIFLNPHKPVLYLSFFQRGEAVYGYDLLQRKIVSRYVTPYRGGRMLFDPKTNELLVCLPLQGEVLRLDADTLEKKGSYKVTSGVRAIAIDETRRVMMVGSLLTGKVALYDMTTGTKLHDWYLAPWVRYIELNPATGIAYVSTNGALLKFNYADYAKL